MMRMNAETRLEIVPGARPLFEEPGALDKVALPAREWLARHPSRLRRFSQTDSGHAASEEGRQSRMAGQSSTVVVRGRSSVRKGEAGRPAAL